MFRLFRAIVALPLLSLTTSACSREPVEASNVNVQNAVVENTPTGPDQGVAYPPSLNPLSPLILNGGKADSQPTHHTLGDMLCPFIADGWTLYVSPEKSIRTGEESHREINYLFTRDGDKPMLFYVTRFEKTGLVAIERLNEIKTGDHSFVFDQAWPFLNEVFSQNFPECAG